LFLGIRGIEESSVYQSIFAKGVAAGRAKAEAEAVVRGIATGLLVVGGNRFGAPDERVEAAIRAISDRERLFQVADRVFEVSSWDELLAPVLGGSVECGGSDRQASEDERDPRET
jgi:hypothetical protein